jgi:hypothetical protein
MISKTQVGLAGALALLVGAGCGSDVTAAPRPATGAHTLFLQFEGQALSPGVDDPAANRSSLLSGSVAIPAYLAGDPQRAAKLQALVAETASILAPYDILLVTSRPASGSYDMVVAGGLSAQAGLPSGLLGAAPVDCSAGAVHLSLLFDLAVGHDAARQIVDALGSGHAVPASTAVADCMCAGAGCPVGLTAPCTIGGAGTPVAPGSACAGAATSMDEAALFRAAFGSHP